MASEPVERLAADAVDARVRIASTIDEIQDRFDPRRILDDAMGRLSGGGLQLAGQARDMARNHPLALVAAAAAVGIALFARNRLSNARVDLGDGATDYTDYDDGYGDETPQTLVDEPVEAETGANPLTSIIIGLAAGAALGALFPATEAERRVMRDTGNRLGSAAKSAARRAVDEIGNMRDSVGI